MHTLTTMTTTRCYIRIHEGAISAMQLPTIEVYIHVPRDMLQVDNDGVLEGGKGFPYPYLIEL